MGTVYLNSFFKLPVLSVLANSSASINSNNLTTYTFSNKTIDDGLIVIGGTCQEGSNTATPSSVTVGGEDCGAVDIANATPNNDGRAWFFTYDNSASTVSSPADVVVNFGSSQDSCGIHVWTVNRAASFIGITDSGNDTGGGADDTIVYSGEDSSGDSIIFIASMVEDNSRTTQAGTDGVEDGADQLGGENHSNSFRRYVPNDDPSYPGARNITTDFDGNEEMTHVILEVTTV
jgi:hypothetical protein